MSPDFKKLMQSLHSGKYFPFYLIDGEEPYYLDIITNYFEQSILQPSERDFNLMVLYGKDASWTDVVNACRRFPMFAERQVVIVKDAAQLKGFNDLSGYLENPAPTTILLIEHRFKKANANTKVVKIAKDKGIYFTSDKIKDDHIPGWIKSYGKEINFEIGERESEILATYLGGDLQKIVNEISKVRINVPDEHMLTMAHIQKYIGISREYNIFEFPEALTTGDFDKMYRMLSYFISNPKSAPMPLVIATFYGHFNRIYQAQFLKGKPEKDAATALSTYPGKVREIMAIAAQWPLQRVENCLLLLGQYSTMTVGINSNTDDRELLKEMIGRILMS